MSNAPAETTGSALARIRELEAELAAKDAEIERLREEGEVASLRHPRFHCGLSWSGFNIRGDEKSIAEVKAALHAKDIDPQLRQCIRDERERAEKAEAERDAAVKALEPLLAEPTAELKTATERLWNEDQDKLVEFLRRNETPPADLLHRIEIHHWACKAFDAPALIRAALPIPKTETESG